MLKTTLLAAALLASACPAFAQAPPQTAQQRGVPQQQRTGTSEDDRACRPDALKFCPDVIGNNMAVLACFKENRAKLSPACTGVLRGYGQL